MMLDIQTALFWLFICSSVFAIIGIVFARSASSNISDFLVARNSQNSQATFFTLTATAMGTWVLFGPAESATWGGIGAILGYAFGSLVPQLVMVPLGTRIREIMPSGYTLTDFVHARYGVVVYAFVLIIMLFYLFISLSAGLTGIAQMVAIVAPVPLWLTASIVMFTTLLYTLYGGLRATILTDKLQLFIIMPFIALVLLLGWQATGGFSPVFEALSKTAPTLMDPFDAQGIETGIMFFLAVALTGVFYQGTWQRIFSAKDNKALTNGFIYSGVLSFPIIVLLGLFGLAFVGLSIPGDASIALFSVILNDAPTWLLVGLIFFGLALISSSADSTISGLHSLFIVDLNRLAPSISKHTLMRISRVMIILISVSALFVASQGYSILYLFLLADLFCCAAAFPVFFGFYNAKYMSYQALLSIIAGLVSGFYYFPMPGEPLDGLFESFVLASAVPVVVSLLCLMIPSSGRYDFSALSKTNDMFKH